MTAPETPTPEQARSRRRWYLAVGAVGAAVLLVGGVAVGTSLTGGAPSATGAGESAAAASSSAAAEAPTASSEAAEAGLVLRVELSEATVQLYRSDNLNGKGQAIAVFDYDRLASLQPGQYTVDAIEVSQDGTEATIGTSDGSTLTVSTTSLVTATGSVASSGDPQAIVGAQVVIE